MIPKNNRVNQMDSEPAGQPANGNFPLERQYFAAPVHCHVVGNLSRKKVGKERMTVLQKPMCSYKNADESQNGSGVQSEIQGHAAPNYEIPEDDLTCIHSRDLGDFTTTLECSEERREKEVDCGGEDHKDPGDFPCNSGIRRRVSSKEYEARRNQNQQRNDRDDWSPAHRETKQ